MALFCWMLQCNVSVLPVIFKQHKSISNSQEVAYQRLHRNWNALWSSYPLQEKGGTNKSCKVTEKGWTRQTDENRPPRAPPHQHAVKQLWSPCLFVQNSHQPRSGRCGQKEEEIAVNLWVIENTYIPLCLHLYLLLKPPHPFFLSGAHLLYQYSTNGTPFPILFSISHWTELMQTIVCPFAVWRRGDLLVQFARCLLPHLLPIAGIDAQPLFPPLPRGCLWENWGTPQVFDGFYRFTPDSPAPI